MIQNYFWSIKARKATVDSFDHKPTPPSCPACTVLSFSSLVVPHRYMPALNGSKETEEKAAPTRAPVLDKAPAIPTDSNTQGRRQHSTPSQQVDRV